MNECLDNDKKSGASGMMFAALCMSYLGFAATLTDRLFTESEVTEETE